MNFLFFQDHQFQPLSKKVELLTVQVISERLITLHHKNFKTKHESNCFPYNYPSYNNHLLYFVYCYDNTFNLHKIILDTIVHKH